MNPLPKTPETKSLIDQMTTPEDPNESTTPAPNNAQFTKLSIANDPKSPDRVVHLTTVRPPGDTMLNESTTPRPPDKFTFEELKKATVSQNPSDLEIFTTVEAPDDTKLNESATSRPNPESERKRIECREKDAILNMLRSHFHGKDDAGRILAAFVMCLPDPGRRNITQLLCDEDAKTGADGLRLIASDLERYVLVPLKVAHFPDFNRRDSALTDLRETVLPRDGYRCVITKTVDTRSAARLNLPEQDPEYPKASLPRDIVLTRIMPNMALLDTWGLEGKEKENEDDQKKMYDERRENLDLIELCFPGLRKKCAADMVNTPGNTICVLQSVGDMFGKFAVGLHQQVRQYISKDNKRTDVEDGKGYDIVYFAAFVKARIVEQDSNVYLPNLLPQDRLVCFSDNGTGVPLPDPELLGMHMSIGKILDKSGRGKKIDRVLNKWWGKQENKGRGQRAKALERVLDELDKGPSGVIFKDQVDKRE